MIKKEKSNSDKFTKIRFYPFDNDDVRHILVSYDVELKEARFILYVDTSSLSIAEMVKLQEAVGLALNCAEELQES